MTSHKKSELPEFGHSFGLPPELRLVDPSEPERGWERVPVKQLKESEAEAARMRERDDATYEDTQRLGYYGCAPCIAHINRQWRGETPITVEVEPREAWMSNQFEGA